MRVNTNADSKHKVQPEPARPPSLAEAGVVLMDSTLKSIALDRGAAAILGVPNHQRSELEPAVCLPKDILDLIQREKFEDLWPLQIRIRAGNEEYSCRRFLLQFANGGLTPPLVVLHLERHPSASEALYEGAATYHLTNREKEVLGGILMGLTTKELADRMNIRPNTLKAFLRLIKIKMNVTTRAGMVGKLLYANSGGQISNAL